MSKISNAEIKRIRSLAQKKYRDEYGLFVAEGEKMVAEALSSGFEVEAVYRRDEIGEDAMSRISQLSAPSPVLAVVRRPSGLVLDENGIAEALTSCGSAARSNAVSGLFLALDTIRDPGNLGTILRTANAAGYADIVADTDTGHPEISAFDIDDAVDGNGSPASLVSISFIRIQSAVIAPESSPVIGEISTEITGLTY